MKQLTHMAMLAGLLSLPLHLLHSQAVIIHVTSGCSHSPPTDSTVFGVDHYAFPPSPEAEEVLQELLEVVGINPNTFQLKLSEQAENAMATIEGGQRYILYSESFFDSLRRSTQNKWAIYSILAHEIGHHTLGHNFNVTDPHDRIAMELAADEYSATILRMMCAKREEALAAINQLDESRSHPYYPPIIARRTQIDISWRARDDSYRLNGGDPCGDRSPLEFGDGYGQKRNRARNVEGHIKDGELIINFDANPIPGVQDYRSYLVISRNSDISPKPESIEWFTDPRKVGQGRQLRWRFADDGYSRDLVWKREELGIAVFRPRQVPYRVKWHGYVPGATALLLGGVKLAIWDDLRGTSRNIYNTYMTYRNPDDLIYQGDNPSRIEVRQEANQKYWWAQFYRNAGIICLVGGAFLLTERIIVDRRGRKGHLYVGQNGVGIRLNIGR